MANDKPHGSSKLLTLLPDFAVLLIVGAVLATQLFVPPIVGMANNGDFYRLAPWCGAYYINGGRPETQDLDGPDYVARTYRLGPIKNSQGYYSSSVPILWGARIANDFVRRDGMFDIRFVGGAHALLFLVGVFALTSWFSRLYLPLHLLAVGLVGFVFTDVGYFSYFNSFYSEGGSLVFLLFVAAAALRLSDAYKAGKLIALRDGLYVLSAVLLLASKPQNLPLAPVFVLLWWALTPPDFPSRLKRRVAGTLVTAILILVSVGLLVLYPNRGQHVYNHAFLQILGGSSSVVTDLGLLGLDAEYEELAGTHWWSDFSSPRRQRLRDSAIAQVGYSDLARFYVRRPKRFANLLVGASEKAFRFRPWLGNFERSAGEPPRELSSDFAHLSWLKRRIYPKTWWSLALLMGLVLVAPGAVLVGSGRNGKSARTLATLSLGFFLMASMQFAVVLIGEGEIDIEKHLFLFNAQIDLLLVTAATLLALAMVSRIPSPKPSASGIGSVTGTRCPEDRPMRGSE